jgi:hypothetical protein
MGAHKVAAADDHVVVELLCAARQGSFSGRTRAPPWGPGFTMRDAKAAPPPRPARTIFLDDAVLRVDLLLLVAAGDARGPHLMIIVGATHARFT